MWVPATPSVMDYATMSEPATPRAEGSLVSGDAGLDFLRLKWNGHGAKALNALETGGLKLIDEEKFEANTLRGALAGFDHLVGPAGDSTVRLLKHLVRLSIKQEAFDKAEALLTKSVGDHQKVFGEVHYRTLLSLQRLGEYYCIVHRKEDSAIIYNRIVLHFERLEKNARRKAADVALYSTIHLAEHYYHEEKPDRGMDLLLRQLSIFETLDDQSSSMVLKKWVLVLYRFWLPLSERMERVILEILDLYEKENSVIFLNLLEYTLVRYGLSNTKEKLAALFDRTIQIINDVRQKETAIFTATNSHLAIGRNCRSCSFAPRKFRKVGMVALTCARVSRSRKRCKF